MKTKHAKSLCCHTQIYRFGLRRRQCSACKRTWSIRPKKRGRPNIRPPSGILNQVFLKKYTLSQLVQRRSGVRLLNFRHRFRKALRHFIAGPSPQKFPSGPLTLLADGLWFHFHNKPWILYLTALKSCSGKTAVFLDPILLPEKEGASKWKQVFAAIPPEPRARIRALVVDNLNGMTLIAQQEGWVLQLCHFHLILKLQIQRGRARRALKGGNVREEIYRMILQALETPDETHLNALIERLTHLTKSFCGTQRIQATVREFIHTIKYYRAYQIHPELNMPCTTNTVEAMCCIIRDLLRRNRCASSPKSLLQWTTALIRLRHELTCNSKHHQQI
jgi:hypothetical protein